MAHEDGRDARAPDLLDCREEPDLVVDQHVASGRIAPLDVLELLLFVDVDEHVASERRPEAGPPDLVRLEDDVAVREEHRPAPFVQAFDKLECAVVQPRRERVLDQPLRHAEQMRVVRISGPEALQCAQIVGVAELCAEQLELVPVALLPLAAELLGQVPAEVVGNRVVVEQRVVDVEQEDGSVSHELPVVRARRWSARGCGRRGHADRRSANRRGPPPGT